jgi:thymidine kinase
MTGSLSITIGPMFSGKTSKLIQEYNQHKETNNVVAINYSEDTRYHETLLSSHDLLMIPCVMVKNLDYVWNNEKHENYNDLREATHIFVNEAQFFCDLYNIVIDMLEKGKNIHLYGLDGDYKARKFGEILELIPYCDNIVKLHANCELCILKDQAHGNAIFTHRITNEIEQVVIGNSNYIPLCRSCYYKENKKM